MRVRNAPLPERLTHGPSTGLRSLIIRPLTPFCPQPRSCSRSRTRRRWKRWSRRYRESAWASNTGYRRLGKEPKRTPYSPTSGSSKGLERNHSLVSRIPLLLSLSPPVGFRWRSPPDLQPFLLFLNRTLRRIGTTEFDPMLHGVLRNPSYGRPNRRVALVQWILLLQNATVWNGFYR